MIESWIDVMKTEQRELVQCNIKVWQSDIKMGAKSLVALYMNSPHRACPWEMGRG